MKIRPILIGTLSLFFLNSCNNNNILDAKKAYHKEGFLYTIIDSVPYTGRLVSFFENGNISSEFNYVSGVPIGEWKMLGFKGEIVQSGVFFYDSEMEKLFSEDLKYRYCIVSTMEENDIVTYTVNINLLNNQEVNYEKYTHLIKDFILKRYKPDYVEVFFWIGDDKCYSH